MSRSFLNKLSPLKTQAAPASNRRKIGQKSYVITSKTNAPRSEGSQSASGRGFKSSVHIFGDLQAKGDRGLIGLVYEYPDGRLCFLTPFDDARSTFAINFPHAETFVAPNAPSFVKLAADFECGAAVVRLTATRGKTVQENLDSALETTCGLRPRGAKPFRKALTLH
jgi:hypothetical protein